MGFVGLFTPHVVRLLVGNDARTVMAVSVPTGALVVLYSDQISRLAFMPSEIPVGLVTTVLGAPLMIWVARRLQWREVESDSMGYSIELDGVSFSYGEKAALAEVSVSVAAGEFVCLLGPNGAGKTTLARVIAGELSPTGGRVFLGSGASSGEGTELRRHIAYLPQDVQDPPFVTARDLVTLGRFSPRRSLGWRVDAKDKEVVRECLARCLADSFADRPFDRLSGGEKQRVWLSFCLAQQREFLLLDESLHKVDYSRKNLFLRDALRSGQGWQGRDTGDPRPAHGRAVRAENADSEGRRTGP